MFGVQHLLCTNGKSSATAPQVVRVGGVTEERDMSTSAEDHVLLAVVRLAMDASVRATAELGSMSPVQLRALTALRKLGEANLAQLSEEMGVTVSTTSRLVDRLVAAGWAHRGPSPNNRREISLTLSEAGRRLLQRYDERRVELMRECLHRLPAERQEAVLESLADFAGVTQA